MGAKLLKPVHKMLSLFNFFRSLPFTYRIIQTLLNLFMVSMVALVMNSQSQPTSPKKTTHGGTGDFNLVPRAFPLVFPKSWLQRWTDRARVNKMQSFKRNKTRKKTYY